MTDHFRGRLEVFGLADLLQWMELNRRSGRLIVTRGHDRRTLDWKDGEIVYVSGSLPRHRLGVHLLRSGALPAATLYELLARNMTTQENLTRLILEMGHDTLDGLSLRVEELARKLLFEIFEWREADFDYDPTYRVTPILRIGLTLRGQAARLPGRQAARRHPPAVAQGAPGDLGGRRRVGAALHARTASTSTSGSRSSGWTRRSIRSRAARTPSASASLRAGCASGCCSNYLMRPVHEDTAELLLELLKKKSPLDPSALVPIAALDQYLTLDLLILANSLSVDRENSVGTVPEALDRIGPRAATVLIDRLSSTDFPDPADQGPGRPAPCAAPAWRRPSPPGRFAERYGITRERGYTLGLLHCIGYSDLFEIVREMNLPAGPFRGALLETYRPAVGRVPGRDLGPSPRLRGGPVGRRDGPQRLGRRGRADRPRRRPGLRDRQPAGRTHATSSRPTSSPRKSTCCSTTWASRPSPSAGNKSRGRAPRPQDFLKIGHCGIPGPPAAFPAPVLRPPGEPRNGGPERIQRCDPPDSQASSSSPPPSPSARKPPAPRCRRSPERVEVRVLDLDVDVTDSKGQPVTDLTREDFTVKIAGKPYPDRLLLPRG